MCVCVCVCVGAGSQSNVYAHATNFSTHVAIPRAEEAQEVHKKLFLLKNKGNELMQEDTGLSSKQIAIVVVEDKGVSRR